MGSPRAVKLSGLHTKPLHLKQMYKNLRKVRRGYVCPYPTVWKTMKAILFFMTVLLVQVSAATRAQEITLSKQDAPLREIFAEIQRQTGYFVVYSNESVEKASPVSVALKREPLESAMAKILARQPLTFSIEGKEIVIRERPLTNATIRHVDDHSSAVLVRSYPEVRGRVLDSLGNPLQGASIRAINADGQRITIQTKTDQNGNFLLQNVPDDATLEITYIGYVRQAISPRPNVGTIVLQATSATLDEVDVSYSTGYQYIPKERATGSFDHIDNSSINRSVSTDIMSRLENLTPGLLFNHGDPATDAVARTDPFVIRGRSTITANAQPLIVLDDFPYEGNLNNINPNDIESVTILKDAAAASIWGARAGNGVIVVTTKKGRTATPKIEVNSNVSITGRPDLYNINQITPAERIEVERWLFENGRFDGAIDPASLAARSTAIPEAVELMISNPADLAAQLNSLASHNVLDDISKYLYRTSTNQQYNLNISGNQDRITYYMSGGFDRNMSNLVGESYNRVSIRSGNTFKVNDKWSIDATVNFFHIEDANGNNSGFNTSSSLANSFSPYTRLTDEQGNALPVYTSLRKGYVDTVGNGRLLDWTYQPLEEIYNEQHTTQRRDYLVNIGSNYKIIDGLDAQVKYQFQNQIQKATSLFRESSYRTRTEINDFAIIDPFIGFVTYPFPRGATLEVNTSETSAHQGRGQLNFNRDWTGKHAVNALAGFEIRQVVTTNSMYSNIGYDEETGSMNLNINLQEWYERRSSGQWSPVSLYAATGELRDNFISYFSNAAYTYDRRYTLSASFRKDEANLFGVDANQKGTPLWSVGGAWEASNEPFYDLYWLPFLKFRSSYGVSGNISRRAHAQSTIYLYNSGATHPLPMASINSLPNRNLQWENVKQLNVGIDFATKNDRFSGTIEYYVKDATNLLAQTPVDPTYGVSSMYLNVADMKGSGLDVQIRSININKKTLNWQTSLLYSHNATEVTNYLMPVAATGRSYLPISIANPLVGRPLYSVFALPWQGLDPQTGDPVGLVNGERSMDYNAIYNGTPLEDLVFMGTAQPTHFGAIMNTFSYKNIDLSFNISFKTGYYFRRASMSSLGLVNGWTGHADYANRWQRPGDEAFTDVPAMLYPAVANRDEFYRYSEALVERGDHIRLEDLNIGYRIIPSGSNRAFKSIRIFTYMSNLGMLWASNPHGIDPYFNNIPMQRPMFSFGTNIIF